MQLKHIAFLTLSAVSTFAMAEGFDVVVVGSGGAGLSSAITAKESGATVVVLEKMAYIGGNSNFASGGMNAAGTKQQLAAGVTQDSPELFYKDTMKGGHNLNNPALLKTLTENAKYAEEWLVDLGAKFCFRKGRGACDRRLRRQSGDGDEVPSGIEGLFHHKPPGRFGRGH